MTVEDQPSGARIVVGGGGPMNGVPVQYQRALRRLLEQLEEPQWLLWWSGADLDELEIEYPYSRAKGVRSVTRRGKNKLKAEIGRPVETLQGRPDLPTIALEKAGWSSNLTGSTPNRHDYRSYHINHRPPKRWARWW